MDGIVFWILRGCHHASIHVPLLRGVQVKLSGVVVVVVIVVDDVGLRGTVASLATGLNSWIQAFSTSIQYADTSVKLSPLSTLCGLAYIA